ncbi:glycosyltransferase [Mycobacterium malmoense]|uniref:glycosyltransferase n=1 Tax=Mycobacterium malmoense TaxID=1780 RepID=UPI0009FA74DC|nr:glycosyltransferase [Mycobacterium malmoense]
MSTCVNGKWLAQSPSGTQRYATEVMRSLSSTPAASQVTLFLPKDAIEPPWASQFALVRSRFRGIFFEQVVLPWLTRGGHLYSLCGPAPVVKRDQTLVMHDATTFRFPSAFRLVFVLWQRLMYTVLSRTAKRVLTVSSFSRAELASVLGVPQDRFEVAPCGADHIEPQLLTNSAEALPFERGSYALIVGNLAPHKNVSAAVAALADSGVPVAVVGGAGHVQHVLRDVQLEGRDNVRLLGRVDDEQLQQLYASAAVLVAPSRYEGFCIPIIEAGRLGCPAVFATGSAMTEVAGEGGLAFDPDDMVQCVKLVKRLISEPALRERLSAQARANTDRFSWARTAQKIFAPGDVVDSDATPAPVRVLHVTDYLATGIRTAIIGYANAIRDQGVESWLLAQDQGKGYFEEVDERSPFVTTRIAPHGLLNLWRAIGSSVAEFRPDIVHLHSSRAGAAGRLRFGLKDKPVLVYTPHCFSFEMRDVHGLRRRLYWVAECVLARRTDAFVCVSPHEAGLARGLRSRADVVVMLNMFGSSFAAQQDSAMPLPVVEAAPARIRIVNVGRATPQKDPEMFAQIVAALRVDRCVEATWVGDGPEPGRCTLQTADITVTGWLAAREVPAALEGQTVYLHTSRWEGGPIALCEAMEAGLPVVVRRNPAYEGYLPEEWQFDEVDEAARMIRLLAEEPARSQRINEQFKVLAEQRKNGPDIVLAVAYRRLMGRSGRPARHHDCLHVNTTATGYGGLNVEDTRWTHRSFPS